MGKPNKLRDLQTQYPNLDEIIPSLVNQFGQQAAAERLGVSQSTISTWLKQNGYVRTIRYEKQEQPK